MDRSTVVGRTTGLPEASARPRIAVAATTAGRHAELPMLLGAQRTPHHAPSLFRSFPPASIRWARSRRARRALQRVVHVRLVPPCACGRRRLDRLLVARARTPRAASPAPALESAMPIAMPTRSPLAVCAHAFGPVADSVVGSWLVMGTYTTVECPRAVAYVQTQRDDQLSVYPRDGRGICSMDDAFASAVLFDFPFSWQDCSLFSA